MGTKITGILKQSNILGRWWGNVQLVAQHTNIFIQMAVFGFSGIAAYGVISEGLSERGHNVPFWEFALICILGMLLVVMFVWKFTLRSTFSSWNYQWWNSQNPAKDRWNKRDKEIDEQFKKINMKLDALIKDKEGKCDQ